jgi:hypothetical protein
MSLSRIFQLFRGGQFYWWGNKDYLEKITDLVIGTDCIDSFKANHQLSDRSRPRRPIYEIMGFIEKYEINLI